ncbi:UNVERIFIED_CONTAM: hypothetical protein GTU68_067040 [Idotea baltica]|nr:hypothetical protein [Idotea baltica]
MVVGGGDVAERKLSLLMEAGARVTLVAPHINETIKITHQDAIEASELVLVERCYDKGQMTGVDLVIVATDDEALNKTIARDAGDQHIFVNVVDNLELCTFIMPSIVDRSPVTIAISTGGNAPILARLLRGKIETFIPHGYGELAKLAAKYRYKVKNALSTVASREIAERIFSGNQDAAEQQLQEFLAQEKDQSLRGNQQQGEVYLVGAGPGDPDLLTFRALRLMQKADIVIYDRLVSDEVLNLVRRDAHRMYVGKEASKHCVPQDQINGLLYKLAKEGKRVLRLKGGDPFIFGRGGEEAEKLFEEGIQFQVVPGITAASGASTYCGIPLTHRDYAQSVTFATGHLKKDTVDLDWPSLAHQNQTLVIYMGLGGLKVISKQLILHGMPADTPIAVIHKATQSEQKILVSDLNGVVQKVESEKMQSPCLLIIGQVVKLHDQLKANI